jgi:hypothetical protein
MQYLDMFGALCLVDLLWVVFWFPLWETYSGETWFIRNLSANPRQCQSPRLPLQRLQRLPPNRCSSGYVAPGEASIWKLRRRHILRRLHLQTTLWILRRPVPSTSVGGCVVSVVSWHIVYINISHMQYLDMFGVCWRKAFQIWCCEGIISQMQKKSYGHVVWSEYQIKLSHTGSWKVTIVHGCALQL